MNLIEKKEYEGCDKCQYSGKGLTEYPCNTCVHNAIDHYKPMTNADAIRNMTDEELAKFIRATKCCSQYGADCGYPSCHSMNGKLCNGIKENTDEEILDWLKAEREG